MLVLGMELFGAFGVPIKSLHNREGLGAGVPIELHTSSVHLFEGVGVFPVEHGCFVG